MNFKEQLTKHENILNEFRAKYINKSNQKDNLDNTTSIIIEKKNNSNITNINNLTNNFDYPPNSNDYYDKILSLNKAQEQKEIQNKNLEKENDEENINLEKIDNLLAKLNFKRENKITKSNININDINNNIQEKKTNYLLNEDINKSNNDIHEMKKGEISFLLLISLFC